MYTWIVAICASLLQVPLGVIHQNESKVDEMSTMMDILHKYVPTKVEFSDDPFEDFDIEDCEEHKFHRLLLGSDQLTVARSRTSIAILADHDFKKEHLEGLLPVVEDWHAKQTLLKVSTAYFQPDLSNLI